MFEAISVNQQVVRLTPDGHPEMPGRLNNLAISFQSRFKHTGDVSDLSKAIPIQQRLIQLTPDGQPNMPVWLYNLGISFQRRFKCTGDLSDLEKAISNKQRAIQLIHDAHPHLPGWLYSLGISLYSRFECTSVLSDLSEAISIQQRAVQITPDDHPNILMQLNNLGISFQSRFERTDDLSDLSGAISIQQRAVQLAPDSHSYMPGWLNNLGITFRNRFERTGNLSDLEEAISNMQQAVELTPDGHPDMPMRLNHLGYSFQSRFTRTGDLSDLEKAISTQQRGVQLAPDGHPEMPGWLITLGWSFRSRFERTGDISDISEAISNMQRAVLLGPDGHPEMPLWLNSLGNSFHACFKRTGDLSDLEKAMSNIQLAVQLTPDGDPKMPGWLNDLGYSFWSRFERTGDLLDLEKAILFQQQAVQLAQDGHPDMSLLLNNLGSSFHSRFKRTGSLSDLEEAISNLQQVVQLPPDHHLNISMRLSNLGSSLQSRFRHTGDVSDILKAISTQQQAVQLAPDGHPLMPGWLINLGISFGSRFERTGDISDISEAISNMQRAVTLGPDGHPDMSLWLNNLGISFVRRFQRTGDVSDLSEAISTQQRALQLAPDGHYDIPGWLNNLANSFHSRFHHTNNLADIHSAASNFQKSATTFGPPLVRFNSARQWVQLSIAHDLPHYLMACGIAIDLISEIVGMDSTIEQRHTNLVDISSLTTTAVSVAFAEGEAKKALEWLEQGRCLVWSQLNQLRTPLDHLRAHDEHLAQRFLDISGALEAAGSRSGSGGLSIDAPLSQKISLQDEALRHITLSHQWSELLDEIRNIPQFHNFLRPPQTSDLMKHIPRDGTVILVNVHEARCDALALVSGSESPIPIALENFTHKEASELRERLRRFLSSRKVRMREPDRGPRPVLEEGAEIQSELHFVLGALWLHVVKPILDVLAFSVSVPRFILYYFIDTIFKSTPPLDLARIWWCPTGSLVFLPLHAAGIYGQNEPSGLGSCISDFAISSYTPTVSSLLQKLKVSDNVQGPASSKLLIISQPNTPGCSPIPATTKEMNCVWKIMETYNGECHRLEGEFASVNQVKLDMESHGSIHFACHAAQSLKHPLKSGFYLHDGRLELSEIMKQKFTIRELAFLSACQTSTGNEKLSEEAVHLAAGMLAAGYRSVVATMWSIKDRFGPDVAESFYKDLMERGKISGKPQLDSSHAARALHHAIQGIRTKLGDTEQGLLTWVPYVHFGY